MLTLGFSGLYTVRRPIKSLLHGLTSVLIVPSVQHHPIQAAESRDKEDDPDEGARFRHHHHHVFGQRYCSCSHYRQQISDHCINSSERSADSIDRSTYSRIPRQIIGIQGFACV